VPDTILIVDDEPPVRRTFEGWLHETNLGCEVLSAPDAETALRLANQHPVDLAILDWNLGAGDNGLQLLEDLYVFQPDIIAIMITGYAQQATPLDAMRMGVRDYLDKNSELRRETFLHAVQTQLERLRPAKRERALHARLVEFRATVEKILPLVRTTAAVHDPAPFTDRVRSFLRFVQGVTAASAGVLVVRSHVAQRQPPELVRVHNLDGGDVEVPLVPFADSLASAVLSMQGTCLLADLGQAATERGVRLQAFEKQRRHLLAAALPVGPGVNAVLELFDKTAAGRTPGPFTEADRQFVSAAVPFGTELLRQSVAESEAHRLLANALEGALEMSSSITATLRSSPAESTPPPGAPPPPLVLDRLRQGLKQSVLTGMANDQSLELAELIRELSVRHGPDVLQHALAMLRSVDQLLCRVSGVAEGRP
jgi:DNA-binding NarL/FixJ family response regulator